MKFRKTKTGNWVSLGTSPVLFVSGEVAEKDIAATIELGGNASIDNKIIFYGFENTDAIDIEVKKINVVKPLELQLAEVKW